MVDQSRHVSVLASLFSAALLLFGCSSNSATSTATSTATTLFVAGSTLSASPVNPEAFPEITDPIVGFESNDGKRMIVAGAVRDEKERAALISASRLSFVGYEINDQLIVSQKALLIPDVQTMVDALSQVSAPVSFVYTGANYRLRGVVSNEATRVAVESSLRASLGPITVPFSNELTLAP